MALSSAGEPSPSNGGATETAETARGETIVDSSVGNATDGKQEVQLKPPPPAATTAAAETPKDAPTSTIESQNEEKDGAEAAAKTKPTYVGSEQSEQYVLAHGLLKDGDFENALSTIGEGMERTRALLQTFIKDEAEIEVHESLAPFYYLYGTTLLYQIEEAPENEQMTTLEGNAAGAEPPADAEAAPADGEEGSDAEDAEQDAGGEEQQQEEEQEDATPSGPPAEDMEIAWENLEAARAILETMLKNKDLDKSTASKLSLDLAQVHLREADLQRLNGNNEASINDYKECLKLREKSDQIGPYDRKIADVHYNLGLVYQIHAVQTSTMSQEQQEQGQLQMSPEELAKKIRFWQLQSFFHSLECAKALCGQIAFLCDVEPDTLFERARNDMPRFKTTGENEEDDNPQARTSAELATLRKVVAELQPSTPSNEAALHDLRELLDEIQETIDEAANAQSGVQEVTQMREAISAAVASATGGGGEDGEDGAAATFGSSEAAASSAVAQPIMAIKKKKKRTAEGASFPDNASADTEEANASKKRIPPNAAAE